MADRADITTQIRLFSFLEKGEITTQPNLAERSKISLSFTNVLLKRAIRKGYVKVKAAPYKRFIYYMTPQGFLEKSRLVTDYLDHSLVFFRLAREQYAHMFQQASLRGARTVVFVGVGELAEIAFLSLRSTELSLQAIYDPDTESREWQGIPVLSNINKIDKKSILVITNMNSPQRTYDKLVMIFPKSQILVADFLRISLETPVFAPPDPAVDETAKSK